MGVEEAGDTAGETWVDREKKEEEPQYDEYYSQALIPPSGELHTCLVQFVSLIYMFADH